MKASTQAGGRSGCLSIQLIELSTAVRSHRKDSWRQLEALEVDWRGPRLVAGDFNEVRFDWKAAGLRSDHSPLVIKLRGDVLKMGAKHFSYEEMWHRHPVFADIVRKGWGETIGQNYNIPEALGHCADVLETWNKNEFGHVQKSIKIIKSKLNGLKQMRRIGEIVEQENKLNEELEEWLEMEDFL
ncbi:hypothetical protein QQ045_019380 [Rhodiola kirilowii]